MLNMLQEDLLLLGLIIFVCPAVVFSMIFVK